VAMVDTTGYKLDCQCTEESKARHESLSGLVASSV
jgi:hypothetical protein